MIESTVISGVISYDEKENLEKALRVLRETNLVKGSDDELFWAAGITDGEDNQVMVDDNLLFFPNLDHAEPLLDVIMDVIEYGEASDVKIAKVDDGIAIMHIVDGETVLDIDDRDELIEHFEIDEEEFMDDEFAITEEIIDRIVEWLAEEGELG